MKQIVLSLALILFLTASYAQNDSSLFKIDTNFFSKKTFTIFANRTFGQLATGQNTAALANFGSFDPTGGSFNFNAFTPLTFAKEESTKMVPYLSLETKGDLVSDNTTILFSNSKLNTNVNAALKLHIPLPFFNSISFFASDNEKLFSSKVKLQQEYDIRLDEADTTLNNDRRKRDQLNWQLNEKKRQTRIEYDTVTLYYDSLNRMKLRTHPDTAQIVKITGSYVKKHDQVASLRRDSVQLRNQINALDAILSMSAILQRNHVRQMTRKLKKEFQDSLHKLELAAPLTGLRISWLTFTGNFNKKKYYEYDTTVLFPDRISKRELSAFNLGAEFHLYIQSLHRAHYVNLGYARKKDNNIGDLSTSDLTQKTKTISNGVEREVLEKYSVYTDSIMEHKSNFFYLNYYFMFKNSNLSAVHFFPEFDSRNNGQKIWNLGFGYVISFKDSKKEKSVINAEAYYKFLDLGNETETGKRLFERNEIGVRVGLPLNFVINNK